VDAAGWFANLPAGLTVTATATSGNTIRLTFGGTPAAASSQPFSITIPATVLNTSGIPITVAANPDARFNILAQPPTQPPTQPTTPQPPSTLPKTGDGFPMGTMLALLGAALVAMGWMGHRLRRQRRV